MPRTFPKPSFLIAILLAWAFAAAPGYLWAQPAPAPAVANAAVPAADGHVLIVSIDGLRPDLALRADMPHLRKLMKQGSYTFWAQTIPLGVTLPSHTSMLTGTPLEVHGIGFNDVQEGPAVYPAAVTLFELAKEAGLSTALVAGKPKFTTLAKPGSVDFLSVTDKEWEQDGPMAAAAERILREHQPRVALVHFAEVDLVGHLTSWGTPEQIAAIERADAALGRLLAALEATGARARTLVIVTADHGGQGNTHGPEDPRSRHIPWIAVGPGVAADFDLTRHADLHVKTEDTFATACYFLGLPLPEGIAGQPVTRAFKPAPVAMER